MREDLFPRPAINQLPGATKTGGSRRALGEVVECPCWAVKGENLSGSTMADCRWYAQGASTTAAWAERPAAAPTPGRAGPRRSCRRCLPTLMPAPGSKVCLAAASNESTPHRRRPRSEPGRRCTRSGGGGCTSAAQRAASGDHHVRGQPSQRTRPSRQGVSRRNQAATSRQAAMQSCIPLKSGRATQVPVLRPSGREGKRPPRGGRGSCLDPRPLQGTQAALRANTTWVGPGPFNRCQVQPPRQDAAQESAALLLSALPEEAAGHQGQPTRRCWSRKRAPQANSSPAGGAMPTVVFFSGL